MIYEKLMEIQAELKAPKNQRNTFGNYDYRSCEDILEAVKPILKKQNCALTISDEVVNIGNRYYVKATATLHSGEENMSVTASAREEETKKGMDGAQITGAASSYARKYALNGLFSIDDTKDGDYTNKGDKPQGTAPQPQQSATYSCSACGKQIKDGKKSDGTIVPAETMHKTYGGLCVKCYQAGKANGG